MTMSPDESVQTPKSRGRPRSEEVDHAIVEAVLDTLASSGVSSLTMAGVAERAGVGKATLYRRFPDKDVMLAAAIERMREQVVNVADKGSAYDRLLAMMERTRQSVPHSRNGRIMLIALAESVNNPELARMVYERVLTPRRAIIRDIIQEGIDSGEFSDQLDIDVAMPTVVGPMLYLGMWSMCDPVQETSTESVLRAVLGMDAKP